MEDSVCVDYLSFEWSSVDLVQAYRELKRQKSKIAYNILTNQNAKELKKLHLERNKQTRYENVLWRQMAKSCTNHLGCSNALVDPCILNWQKESDVTWLYGPLYMSPELSSEKNLSTHPSLCFSIPNSKPCPELKSILKQRIKNQDHWWIQQSRPWSKCASDPGKQNVRFNPSIIEIKYMPEVPISNKHEIVSDEEEEDDIMFDITSFMKSILHFNNKPQQIVLAKKQEFLHSCASLVSFTALFLYQAILSIFYQPFHTKNQKALDAPETSHSHSLWSYVIDHIPFFARKSIVAESVLYRLKDYQDTTEPEYFK